MRDVRRFRVFRFLGHVLRRYRRCFNQAGFSLLNFAISGQTITHVHPPDGF